MLSPTLVNLLRELLLMKLSSIQSSVYPLCDNFHYLSFVVICYSSFIECILNYLYVVEVKIKQNWTILEVICD